VKITISYDTSSVDDLLLKTELELEEVKFDLGMPEWYWDRGKWNELRIQKVALGKKVAAYLQMSDSCSTI
jgi:hypothetical protein